MLDALCDGGPTKRAGAGRRVEGVFLRFSEVILCGVQFQIV